MTVTQTCILIWAVLGMIGVAIMLHFLGRGDERSKLLLSSGGLGDELKPPKNSKKNYQEGQRSE
jgi:beta-lactamase regulating signal transducer with metallopeptidase domain